MSVDTGVSFRKRGHEDFMVVIQVALHNLLGNKLNLGDRLGHVLPPPLLQTPSPINGWHQPQSIAAIRGGVGGVSIYIYYHGAGRARANSCTHDVRTLAA